MPSKQVIEAIMHWVVPRLDARLTGAKLTTTQAHYDQSEKNETENLFLGEIYYLSDGGYSRIVFNMTAHSLQLCDGARLEVVERWSNEPYVMIYREMIEDLMTAYAQELES